MQFILDIRVFDKNVSATNSHTESSLSQVQSLLPTAKITCNFSLYNRGYQYTGDFQQLGPRTQIDDAKRPSLVSYWLTGVRNLFKRMPYLSLFSYSLLKTFSFFIPSNNGLQKFFIIVLPNFRNAFDYFSRLWD